MLSFSAIMNTVSKEVTGKFEGTMEASQVKVETVPFDTRFPFTNQTKNCWQNFVDFQKCSKRRGEEDEICHYFKKTFTTLCPKSWVDNWNDQIEDGTFPGNID